MILEAKSIESGYGSSQVLFGVDLNITSGQVVTVLGRNGMGKTTLLRTILGLLPLRRGSVHFAGQDISGWRPDRIARAGIGIVPEGRLCFPNLTVKEHLTAFVANRNPDVQHLWTPERVFDFFPRLAERAQNMGNQLSGGEQQMLAIGRGLMSAPRLILLDEPSLGLAPLLVARVYDRLAAIQQEQKLSALLVEQSFHVAAKLAVRAWVMRHGEIVGDLDEHALRSREGRQQAINAYLGSRREGRTAA